MSIKILDAQEATELSKRNVPGPGLDLAKLAAEADRRIRKAAEAGKRSTQIPISASYLNFDSPERRDLNTFCALLTEKGYRASYSQHWINIYWIPDPAGEDYYRSSR